MFLLSNARSNQKLTSKSKSTYSKVSKIIIPKTHYIATDVIILDKGVLRKLAECASESLTGSATTTVESSNFSLPESKSLISSVNSEKVLSQLDDVIGRNFWTSNAR